jgi:hypothetical protein
MASTEWRRVVSDEFVWTWSWADWDVALRVSASIAEFLRGHRQGDHDSERGGQLFAETRDVRGLSIARATPPHLRDRSGRTWLELDRRRCRGELRQARADGLSLLGYWHTHPESIPQVSPQDIQSFRAFTQANAPTILYPLCVIVGRDALKAWSIREADIVEATRIESIDYSHA